MRKTLFLIMTALFLFASNKSEYLDYSNKLITYNFKLPNFDKIRTPFFKPKPLISIHNKAAAKNVKKIIHISLISILNDSALMKVETFIGTQKVKEYKKWVKINSKLERCKVFHIDEGKVVLKCNKKLLVKRLDKNLLKIRVEK